LCRAGSSAIKTGYITVLTTCGSEEFSCGAVASSGDEIEYGTCWTYTITSLEGSEPTTGCALIEVGACAAVTAWVAGKAA